LFCTAAGSEVCHDAPLLRIMHLWQLTP